MLKKVINLLDFNYQYNHSLIINKKLFNYRFFCVYIKSYLLLKYITKFIDIELLRYVIRDCIIMFQIKVNDAL